MSQGEKRFPEFGSDYSFSALEEKVLAFWKANKSFETLLESPDHKKEFYFYDGPPFATGLPHYGHLLAGTIKDIVPRYWSQRGYRVARRFGWDCHGLPIEFEIEKREGLSGSLAIQEYGVAKFCEECRGAVLRYTDDWQKFVERMGRWIDMDNDYKTMDLSFMESVWWVFKELYDRGLIYQGKKVVPYSWRLTAPLSNFEASQNYKSVQDPAITVLLPLVEGNPLGAGVALAIWTTTPWTLPSNLAVAIQSSPKKLTYSLYALKEKIGNIESVVLADSEASKNGFEEEQKLRAVSASDLLGLHYKPLFSVFDDQIRKDQKAFRILDGSRFVVEGTGTGLVHCAPAFGEDDFYVCQDNGIEVADPTDMEAKFTEEIKNDSRLTSISGVFVKDADKEVIAQLKKAGQLFKQETLQHNYPFCERSDTPLIYKAIGSWFVKVEDLKDKMIANNQDIHWVPAHIKDGRFGKWLENARDWCISRNRFWGTPIPVWICESCSELEVIGAVKDLEGHLGKPVEDIHKHLVDEHFFDCKKCSGKNTMKRTSEVLDCWFESGSMPYAQEHYPFENKKELEAAFPADFIAEGLDQTRGWFYTLTVLSTALFDKPAFKNCIVNGMVLAEDGRKMSKRLKNYPDPNLIFGKYGADALRLYLVQSPAIHGEDLRFSEKQLLELMRAVMLPLWNAYGFFASYANIDGWSSELEKACEYSLLDRWILSRSKELEKSIHQRMEAYELFEVAPLLIAFIDDLTNWYIRLNRDRFWAKNDAASQPDKNAAYSTLYQVLSSLSLNIAPVMPYMAEVLNAALEQKSVDSLSAQYKSVHIKLFQEVSALELSSSEELILSQVSVAKKIILLGRSLRGEAKIGLRQPLPQLRVAGLAPAEAKELDALYDLICQEVNVKKLVLVEKASDLVEEGAKPNFKTLGRKLGKDIQALQKLLSAWTSVEISQFEAKGEFEFSGHQLSLEDIEVVRKAKPGKLAQAAYGIVAELDTEISEELLLEGIRRELVNRIQQRRKEMKLDLTDRIEVKWWATPSSLIEKLLLEEKTPGYIAGETLCSKVSKVGDKPSEKSEAIATHGELSFTITKS
ncbi:isoleucine--tRNA ligase [bacterium]|nr:isoleucine--tRNA ligase [bacterium]